ncbi:RNA polymerase sporulation sigma factor SigK [Oscillospiraceae bacterium CM]|nr:RNA polymerase sporulation sigma factor SigK [Oscillospiraceae bacterium CM]
MLSATFAIFLMSPFLMLRMSEGAGSFPKPLSAAEEQTYIELFMTGDMEARNVLIERNLRLVAHIIKKYYTQTSEQDDLISIGTIGLIKGISTYKPDRRVRLATYASRCIENEILMHFRSLKKTAGDLSLSDSIDTDKDGNSLSLMEVISVEDNMLENLSARETCQQLCQYMNDVLTQREAEIITMRYGLQNKSPKTQREIAIICGISRSYVSRIEKKALEKLRKCFEANS